MKTRTEQIMVIQGYLMAALSIAVMVGTLCGCCLLAGGCAKYTIEGPDGSKLVVEQFAMDSKAAQIDWSSSNCDPNDVCARTTFQLQGVQTETAQIAGSIAEGAVRGALSGAGGG